MARPDKDDDRKKRTRPTSDKKKADEQEQKEDETNQKDVEPEHVRAQNQVGNAALAAMMGNQQGGGRGGTEVEMVKRKTEHQKVGEEYGGEDDPGDPNAALEWEAEEWNAGMGAISDRPEFLDPMPDADLPEEDAAWLEALPEVEVAAAGTVDRWLQPSTETLAAHPIGWFRGAIRLSGSSLAERALAMLIRKPGPLLQDPHGRMLPVRARIAALADLLLVAAPPIASLDAAGAAFVRFLLEAEGRDVRVRAARIALGNEKKPSAATLFDMLMEQRHPGIAAAGRVDPVALPPGAAYAVDDMIRMLLMLEDPRVLVPRLTEPGAVDAEDDDPLGLDAAFAGEAGAVPDVREAAYKTGLQGAERLASVLHLTRVRAAGTANVIAETAIAFVATPPEETLRDVMVAIDGETHEIMQILKEIARASQRRSVPLPNLGMALARAANTIADLHLRLRAALGALAAASLPAPPDLPRASAPIADPLNEAWADGVPGNALPWLAGLPASVDRDAAIAFTRLAFEPDPRASLPALEDLRARGGPWLSLVAGAALGPCLVAADRLDDALEVATAQAAAGLERSNGIVVADATLLACDVLHAQHHPRKLQKVRKEAGAWLKALGAAGPLSLVARWEPPEPEAPEQAWVEPIPPPLPEDWQET